MQHVFDGWRKVILAVPVVVVLPLLQKIDVALF